MPTETDEQLFQRLIAELGKPPLSTDDAEKLRRAAVKLQFDTAWNSTSGKPVYYGDIVTKIAGDGILVDGHRTYEIAYLRQHDLTTMLRCCLAELATYRKTGDTPAPFYFWRVAVLLSKAHRFDEEVALLEGFLPFSRVGAGQRYQYLVERLPKARKRAMKSHQRNS